MQNSAEETFKPGTDDLSKSEDVPQASVANRGESFDPVNPVLFVYPQVLVQFC